MIIIILLCYTTVRGHIPHGSTVQCVVPYDSRLLHSSTVYDRTTVTAFLAALGTCGLRMFSTVQT